MRKTRFSKNYISIQNIGLKRFWAGVVAGLFSSVSLSLAFNYTREVYRLITGIEPDLLILDRQEFLFYDIFFATLAASLGFSIAVWIWMNNNNHLRKRDGLKKQLAKTFSLLSFWVFFGVVARFGTNLPIILYRTRGYDNHLNLRDDFWLIFVLIPIVVFFQSWLGVRLVYRPGKWIWLSLICCLTMSLVLFKTTGVDREIVNTNYFLRYETQLLYVESEILNAKKEYGIDFDQNTINSLKKFYTESSFDQFESVRLAFRSGRKVSLDTIIMQKILLHNMKEGYWQYYWPRKNINNWQYSLPTEILKQIYLHGPGTPETGELFNILNLQIELANISLTGPEYRNSWSNLTHLEMQRVLYANYHLPEIIIDQLVSILGELKSMPEYRPYIEKLDDLKYED